MTVRPHHVWWRSHVDQNGASVSLQKDTRAKKKSYTICSETHGWSLLIEKLRRSVRSNSTAVGAKGDTEDVLLESERICKTDVNRRRWWWWWWWWCCYYGCCNRLIPILEQTNSPIGAWKWKLENHMPLIGKRLDIWWIMVGKGGVET